MPTIDDNRLRLESDLGGGILMPSLPGYYYFEIILNDGVSDVNAFLYELYVGPATMAASVNPISDDVN